MRGQVHREVVIRLNIRVSTYQQAGLLCCHNQTNLERPIWKTLRHVRLILPLQAIETPP